jgi:uncharacterized cupredoxin-like copper-binding protein
MTIHLGPPAGGAGAAGDRPHPAAARRPRRGGRRALLAGLLALLVAAAVAWVGTHRAGADPRVRTVVVTMHHSRFQPAAITVAPGAAVRFVLRNTDPIDHEFIIGGKAVHQLHERGTQRSHHGPGEVSVPAGQERSTTVSFNLAAPGQLEYACHLPGHYAYGMRGLVTVMPGGPGAQERGPSPSGGRPPAAER